MHPKYIPALDGLRAVAIAMVLLNHLGLNLLVPDAHFWILCDGMAGVRLFFVLSGFLITSQLMQSFESNKQIDLKSFWYRRFFRIVPPLLFFLIVMVQLSRLGFVHTPRQSFYLAALSLYNFIPAHLRTPEISHLWSLSLEEQFYAFWPLLLWWKPRLGAWFACALVAVCLLARVTYGHLGFDENTLYLSKLWTVPAADAIAIGALFALAKRWLLSMGVEIAVLFWIASYPPSVAPIAPTIQAIGFGILVLNLTYDSHHWLSGLLSKPFPVWIGKLSYSLYLWQGLFLRTGPGLETPWFQRFPQNLGLAFGMATISYYTVERYFRRAKGSRLPKGRALAL